MNEPTPTRWRRVVGACVPGLAQTAALAVLCEGREERLDLVRRELFVGDVLGQVPDSTPMVPLAQDLRRRQRALRLQPTTSRTIQVDLRQHPQLSRSVLLHRLRILGIDWGAPLDTSSTGTAAPINTGLVTNEVTQPAAPAPGADGVSPQTAAAPEVPSVTELRSPSTR